MPTLEEARQSLMAAAVAYLYHPKQKFSDQERQYQLAVLANLFSRCRLHQQLHLVRKEARNAKA